jgi:MFS family permease
VKTLHRLSWIVTTLALVAALAFTVGLLAAGSLLNWYGRDGWPCILAGISLLGALASACPAIYSYFAAAPKQEAKPLARGYMRRAYSRSKN